MDGVKGTERGPRIEWEEEGEEEEGESNDGDDDEEEEEEEDQERGTDLEALASIPTPGESIYKISRQIKRQDNELYSCLRSIYEDSMFVDEIAQRYSSLPLLANLRCGLWYSRRFDGTCYFKSTDGHMGNWSLSLTRLNMHVAMAAAIRGGCVIVDATRRGKRFPDSLSKSIPIWTCALNRAVKRHRLLRRHSSSSSSSSTSSCPAVSSSSSSSSSLSTSAPLSISSRTGQTEGKKQQHDNGGSNGDGGAAVAGVDDGAAGAGVDEESPCMPGEVEEERAEDGLHLRKGGNGESINGSARVCRKVSPKGRDAALENADGETKVEAPAAAVIDRDLERVIFGARKGSCERHADVATAHSSSSSSSLMDSHRMAATRRRQLRGTADRDRDGYGDEIKDRDWDCDLHLPLWISETEKASIAQRMDGWVDALASSGADVPSLARGDVFRKPLRPLWISQSTRVLSNETPEIASLPFTPLILVSASLACSSSSHSSFPSSRPIRKSDGDFGCWTYIAGAGDDEESWARGLEPATFWKHHREILNAGPAGCNRHVAGLVEVDRVYRAMRGGDDTQVRRRRRSRRRREGEKGAARASQSVSRPPQEDNPSHMVLSIMPTLPLTQLNLMSPPRNRSPPDRHRRIRVSGEQQQKQGVAQADFEEPDDDDDDDDDDDEEEEEEEEEEDCRIRVSGEEQQKQGDAKADFDEPDDDDDEEEEEEEEEEEKEEGAIRMRMAHNAVNERNVRAIASQSGQERAKQKRASMSIGGFHWIGHTGLAIGRVDCEFELIPEPRKSAAFDPEPPRKSAAFDG
ncbi:hypothetical protein CBR_g41536 [Chara braunii]|uniref:Ig-like domain-containing protein n=1 Tax=Chara braunii TaxID=69332 RepID=A0A388K2T9_CHABU|nr:hypothetical protein CBR_g41536 [Chara braunii]|eukprot:GBG64335.1 hypothetical protein CBR_g41536 [Chara braunii]